MPESFEVCLRQGNESCSMRKLWIIALMACSNECSEVQLEVASTMPAKVLAQAILARAFKFFPSATATGRYFVDQTDGF